MSNPYATERFLRNQVRMRDERIKMLETALRAASSRFDELYTALDKPTAASIGYDYCERALAAPLPEKWERAL